MDPAFQKRLLATYRLEAAEHLQEVTTRLLALEEEQEEARQQELLRGIYREFHSLKGAARAVNETAVEAVCHRCEEVLSRVSRGTAPFSADLLERLRRATSFLTQWHQAPPGEFPPSGEEALTGILDLFGGRQESPAKSAPAPRPTQPPPDSTGERKTSARPARAATVRTPVERLDAILYRAEEILEAKEEWGRGLYKMIALRDRMAGWRREWGKMQADSGFLRFLVSEATRGQEEPAIRELMHRLHGFLDWNRDFVEEVRRTIRDLVKEGLVRQGAFDLSVDRLLEETKEVLMVPFAHEMEGLAVLVREEASAGRVPKEARLRVEGAEVEVDRRILEAMKDPFVHLVRNAIDHSLEEPAARAEAGKPAEGMVQVSIVPLGDGTVEVTVADDGRGIAVDDLRRKAVAAGLANEREVAELPLPRLFDLLFEPEFSTRTTVSKLSGRGLGLAIVRERAEQLGGYVSVSSDEGRGTTFRLVLPLSLARFRAVEVLWGEDRFLVPSTKIKSAGRIQRGAIRPVKGQETIQYRAKTVPLHQLGTLLGLPPGADQEQVVFITVESPRAEFAIGVHEIGEEREIVMKSLGPQLRHVRHIAGASLGHGGAVIPILNIADLAETVLGGRPAVAAPSAATRPERSRVSRVLVVEDSITARSLLKNILEGSGYRVVTARDGVEALAAAQADNFDLVLTDVEMPRMDGIELTRQLRADERLRPVPVVILTALASREDKERGMLAGADAYVVKSSFDQSDLLETVRELLQDD